MNERQTMFHFHLQQEDHGKMAYERDPFVFQDMLGFDAASSCRARCLSPGPFGVPGYNPQMVFVEVESAEILPITVEVCKQKGTLWRPHFYGVL